MIGAFGGDRNHLSHHECVVVHQTWLVRTGTVVLQGGIVLIEVPPVDITP